MEAAQSSQMLMNDHQGALCHATEHSVLHVLTFHSVHSFTTETCPNTFLSQETTVLLFFLNKYMNDDTLYHM
jgi:hypothetical protein